jgi:hypothetical protein
MQRIRVPSGANAYEVQRTQLTGSDFELRFAWNGRAESWTLDIGAIGDESQAEPTPILAGAKLFIGHDLLGRCNHPMRPLGSLRAYSNDGSAQHPGLTDFGVRCFLAYLEPGEAL